MQFKVKAARSGLGVLNLDIDAGSIEEAKKLQTKEMALKE